MKPCNVCGQEFPATAEYFYRDNSCKDGMKYRCKKCDIAKVNEYRAKNRKKILERRRELREEHKEQKVPKIYYRFCSFCSKEFKTRDWRKKLCPLCSAFAPRKRSESAVPQKYQKGSELYRPIDECYMHLLEEMVENCDVLAKGWHYEGHHKIPGCKFLVACKTCTIKDYCPNSNGQCKDLPVVMKVA